MPALVITSGSQQGTRAEIVGEISIGRENQDLILADVEVSRRHARVRSSGGRLEIEDLGSSNGTWVNGRRISAPTPLADGDEVVMGQTYLRVEGSRSQGTIVSGAGATAVTPGEPPAGPPTGGTDITQSPPSPQVPTPGGTAVAPANLPPPAHAPGGPAQPPLAGDPSHTAPMPTYSYDAGPPAPIEGPGRRVGPIIGIVIGALVVLGLIAALAFFLLNRGPSKEEFITEADNICAENSDRADALEQPGDVPLVELAPFFEEITQIQQDEVEQLRALEAPDEDAEILEDFLGTQDELASLFRTMTDAATADDQDAFDGALADATTVQTRASALAEDYGFVNCGKSTPGGE